MITNENQSDVSPDDLAKLRAEQLLRLRSNSSKTSDGKYGTDSEQAENDQSLLISRALAITAIATICSAAIWFHPITLLCACCAISVMFFVHYFIQERQVKRALDRSIVGVFSPLPRTSMLWGVAIPLTFVCAVDVAIAASNPELNERVRWFGVCAVALLSCLFATWKTKRGGQSALKLLGFANGAFLGVSAASLVVFAGLSLLVNPADSTSSIANAHYVVSSVGIAAVLCLIYGYSLIKKSLLKVERARSFAVFCSACVGALIAFAVGIAPELRGFAIVVGEKLASSSDRAQQDAGYKILDSAGAAEELKDAKLNGARLGSIASFPTAFFSLPINDIERIYYFLTGKSMNGTSTQDATNSTTQHSHGVNTTLTPIDASLVESKLTGHVDADALTSVTYWSMTFKNNKNVAQEAQAFLSVPPNSVVSRITLWINGVPQEAAFNYTNKVQAAYNWIVQYHRDPLLVTEVTPGLLNLKAYPVPAYGEMKVRIGITTGLEANSKRDFSFTAPKIVSSNFGIDGDLLTDVKLESNARITSNAKGKESSNEKGKFVYKGQIAPNGEENFNFVAHRESDFTNFTARATHSAEDMVISERLSNSAKPFNKLAIVIDASKAVGEKRNEIKEALKALPSDVQAQVFFADHRDMSEACSVSDAISKIDNVDFTGGVDSLPAIQAAKKYLGRHNASAIAWIHDSKPLMFEEDKSGARSLLDRSEHRLKIFELQIGEDSTNSFRSFMTGISTDASPEFSSIARAGSVAQDLGRFFKSSGTEGVKVKVVREKIPNKHASGTSYAFPVASRLSTVWAAEEARKCIAVGEVDTAGQLGNVFRIITPVTGAVVLETQSDYTTNDLARNFYSVVSKNVKAKKEVSDGTSTLDSEYKNKQAESDAEPQPEFALGWGGNSEHRRRSFAANEGDSSSMAVDKAAMPASRSAMADDSFRAIAPAPSAMASPFAPMATPMPKPTPAPMMYQSRETRVAEHSSESMIPPPPPTSMGGGGPQLQGATNGTIGPQGSDATYVESVAQSEEQTARLAKNEDVNRVILELAKMLAMLVGALLLVKGLTFKLSKSSAIKYGIVGTAMLAVGFALPYVVSLMQMHGH
ncbi:MAG TPA: VIT domain-containing protein [Drouetiella sp.]